MNAIEQAYEFANHGQLGKAEALLGQAGQGGDAGAWVELGVWLFSARYLPRDLRRARTCFTAAAELGHRQAQQVVINLSASGVGGDRDWVQALAGLKALAQVDQTAAEQVQLVEAMKVDWSGEPSARPAGERKNAVPLVQQFPHFLTAAECRYLVARATPQLSASVVVDPATNRLIPHPVRTSDNMAFGWLDEDPVIQAVNRRIAVATNTAVDAGEPLQVLRYQPGQEYRPHHDALPGTDNQRIVTFLIYLNDGYAGGETVFPKLGLTIEGAAGSGLMFRNTAETGQPDPAAVHAGCPIQSGTKFLATRWIRQARFGPR